jgi:hypothetical protein
MLYAKHRVHINLLQLKLNYLFTLFHAFIRVQHLRIKMEIIYLFYLMHTMNLLVMN